MPGPRIPVATYRLQLHSGFTFAGARRVLPYLDRLGITACYASSFLEASPGSAHGYDICDHTRLNPELGSEADFAEFAASLAAHTMGLVLDIVPDHMGVDEAANVWWRDVLENGPCSPFAPFFDIDWQPVKAELKDKLLLPILGDQYGNVLERGELQLLYRDGAFSLRYFDHDLPVNPRFCPRILEHDIDRLRAGLGDDATPVVELLSIATALRNLPAYTETEPERIAERRREKQVARERLQRLVEAAAPIREHIEHAVRVFNGKPGSPESFDQLHALLELQPYRLAYWRTASHEINYRRFFDINQLAGLRMEDAQVFAATHALVLQLVAKGTVTGLRIDHIDGLYNPAEYLERLQHALLAEGGVPAESPVVADITAPERRFYIVTEKILSQDERLPERWTVAGTSGYDFLNDLNGIFVNARNAGALQRVYRRFTGLQDRFEDVAYQSKRLIMDTPMASELNVLAHTLNRLSECDRRTRDFTLNSLRDALQEVIACFPIYRTYVTARGFTADDRAAIDRAIRGARRRNPTMEPTIFEFLRRALLPGSEPPAARADPEQLAFAMKFQQYTGPVQAKGVEDTAFYRYNLLTSLNEVGGEPSRFGRSPAEFHAANLQRRAQWPFSMLATATHDTKRGEDVRARLNALSELVDEWGPSLSLWARLNGSNRSVVDGRPAPDRNDEYLFYQTLLGTWPPGATSLPGDLIDRLREYMLKAVREAKVHTSWVTQDQAYEEAVTRFVERTLRGTTAPRFLAAFVPFAARLARLGMINSLSQLVLKVAAPGVPDFYQGTELWDLNLVDPDNRRAVDYDHRAALLAALEPALHAPSAAFLAELLEHWEDARIKLFLTAVTLRFRRAHAALFLSGEYQGLEARGEREGNVVAFARRLGTLTLIAAVPRLMTQLTSSSHELPLGVESWGETQLVLPAPFADATYRNLFTHEELQPLASAKSGSLPLAAVFATSPVAWLWSAGRM